MSIYDFKKLLSDLDNIANNLHDYINGFSKVPRGIMEHFEFDCQFVRFKPFCLNVKGELKP